MLLNNSSPSATPPRIIESLFVHKDAIKLHLAAPLVAERQRYLAALVASGMTQKYVSQRATFVRHVVEVLAPSDPRAIDEVDIAVGLQRWIMKTSHATREESRTRDEFKAAARSWARFLGIYQEPHQKFCRFESEYQAFLTGMRIELGLLPASISAAAKPTKRFLLWITPRGLALTDVSLLDIDRFIDDGRARGWSPRTIKCNCQALRTFFRYAELRGWSCKNLSRLIKAPVVCSLKNDLRLNSWSEVCHLIGALDITKTSQCRAKAVLLLASKYGMRSCEIADLKLEDLDWSNEVITVRRAKRGRMQQFPLLFEVGQAIIDYLERVRPHSIYRNVFLTLHAPYRPVAHMSQSMWRLLRVGVFGNAPCGLHSLRHACATELLRCGTSLQGIADFLGHRNLRSVSIYAHCDSQSLRQIAAFDLGDVL